MKLVLIADVGGPDTYHVGDEAMLEANLTELSRRHPDSSFTVVSRDPEATSRLYDVQAVPPIGFPSGPSAAADRERLLSRLLGSVEAGRAEPISEPSDDPNPEAVQAVRRCDALVVSGGGNLNSFWPEHLYERVALLRAAQRLGKRTVVLGQTLGPQLDPRERQLLRMVLADADLVGVRERHSFRRARSLGVPEERLSLQLDDAFFLEPRRPLGPVSDSDESRPWIALTFTRGMLPIDRLAAQLTELAAELDAGYVFVPHARTPDEDREVGEALSRVLGPGVELRILDVEEARVSRWRLEGASMVISNRYHPVVFALAAGVPALGIYIDDYTRVKVVGALEHAGLGGWSLPWVLAREGALLDAARELWSKREIVAQKVERYRGDWREMRAAHWRRVDVALRGAGSSAELQGKLSEEVPTPADPGMEQPASADPRAQPEGRWGAVAGDMRDWAVISAAERWNLEQQRDEAVRYADSLREVLAARDEEIAGLRGALETERVHQRESGMEADVEREGSAEVEVTEPSPEGRDSDLDPGAREDPAGAPPESVTSSHE